MDFNEFSRQCHETSVSKGWYETYDDGRTRITSINVPEKLALIHSEVSEALEEFRQSDIRRRCVDCGGMGRNEEGGACEKCGGGFVEVYSNGGNPKPEGFVVELADVMIRIGDLCGALGLDLDTAVRVKQEYNKTRDHRHGNKKC